jgi:hypothetical protein
MANTKNTFTIIAVVPGIGVWSQTFHSRESAMACSLIGPTRLLMIEE